MKKRIYGNMLLITFLGVILTAILICITFYGTLNRQMEKEVKNQAVLLARSIEFSTEKMEYMESLKLTGGEYRLTLIGGDGAILYDSATEPDTMESHADRPEFLEAIDRGHAQNAHFSSISREKMFYYAVRLNDNTVLRLSKMSDSVFDILSSVIPVILMVVLMSVLLCYIIALSLTKRIIAPINKIDLTSDQEIAYEELSPFLRAIKAQRQQIYRQMSDLEYRTSTINAITANMKEGLLLLDKKGSVLLINNSALELLNVHNDDYVGKNTLELIRSIDLQNHINEALSGHHGNTTLQLGNKIVGVFLSPVLTEGIISGAIALFLDITAQAEAEKRRKEFSANVSHELKTPLTAISGYMEMIYNDMVKEEDIKVFLGRIKGETDRLIALTEDIIKLSELDENSGYTPFSEFDIMSVTMDAIKQLQPVADLKNVLLNVSGDNIMIKANNRMIFEMLYNTVDNAIKYNNPDGFVDIKVSCQNGDARIVISDNGIGIADEHLDRIFERFYRADKSRSKKTGGTGLGLSIVKHIAEYHGGSVSIESALDKGTTLTIVFPRDNGKPL